MSVSANSGVSAGADGSALDDELRAVYQGGGDFMARVQLLERSKKDAAAALAELKLATTAQAWRDEAKKLLESARSKHAEAEQALADAKAAAARAVADANAVERAAHEAATKTKADATAAATKVRADADAYAAEAKRSADEFKSQAVAAVKKAEADAAKIQGALDAAAASKAQADAAKAQAERVQADYEQRAQQLRALIG